MNRVRFPPHLEHLATSLALEGGRMVDRHALLLALAQNLERALALATGPRAAELLPAYRSRTGLMGRIVQVQTHAERVRGALVDVDFENVTLDTGRRIALGSVVSLREADSE